MNENLNDVFIEMVNTRILVDVTTPLEATMIIPCRDLQLNIHEGMPYLTLKDISDQIKERMGEKLLLIDVWEELGLNGYIYRYVTDDHTWRKHGTTRGFA